MPPDGTGQPKPPTITSWNISSWESTHTKWQDDRTTDGGRTTANLPHPLHLKRGSSSELNFHNLGPISLDKITKEQPSGLSYTCLGTVHTDPLFGL